MPDFINLRKTADSLSYRLHYEFISLALLTQAIFWTLEDMVSK